MKFKITLKIDRKHGDLLPFNCKRLRVYTLHNSKKQ